MAIQLTAGGPSITKDAAWHAKREEFARRHCVVFENFIAPSLLEKVPEWLETSLYFDFVHPTDTRELVMRRDQPLVGAFEILLNQGQLFKAIAEFAGLEEDITFFDGRCYKRLPIDNHSGHWHSDGGTTRRVGLSISLSPKPVQGGVFRIRRARTGEVFRQVPAGRLGDAHLFRLANRLEHCVSSVEGKNPKYAFAGWFLCGGEGGHRGKLRSGFAPA